MEKLNIADLTQRMNDFVQAKGWYEEKTNRKQTPKNIASSLIIESAEVLEHFQWLPEDQEVANKDELAAELADVQLYLLQLASICKIDLEKAVLNKLEVNMGRTWS